MSRINKIKIKNTTERAKHRSSGFFLTIKRHGKIRNVYHSTNGALFTPPHNSNGKIFAVRN